MLPRLAYNPGGTLLASCSGDGTVRIWDAEKLELRKTIAVGPPRGFVNAVTFLPDGRHLATANENGTVYVLRLESLADCPKLNAVQVEKTKVTEAGMKKFAAALPRCTIRRNGGTIGP